MPSKQQSIINAERDIMDTAIAIDSMLKILNTIDPVAASNVYKSVLQYLQEKNTTKTTFTVQDLVDLGYIPDAIKF